MSLGPMQMKQWIGAFKGWNKKRRRLRAFDKAQTWSQGLSLEATFEKIYAESKWGLAPDASKFFSGPGSQPEKSARYEAFVAGFLNDQSAMGSLVDIGCGDFQVANRIIKRLSRPIDYTGCDIARSVVEHNTHSHGDRDVRFLQLDAVDADSPPGDVVTIREVLQHLNNSEIARVLERLPRLFKVAIISESLPVNFVTANVDIEHGISTRIPLGSGVYIDQAPFNMKVTKAIDSPFSEKSFLRTSIVWLAP